jgi:6-phosphogluconolactonase/glucosamine-6-phosphate isomerase/deaminase
MSPDIMLGTAKVDITPVKPVPLAGFKDREGSFKGITSRLYARIWYFQQTDSAGRKRKSLIVQADLIWWGSDRMRPIRQQLKEQWGFEEQSIILHASHTHSGPQTSDRFTPSLGEPDPDYVRMLESRLFDGISEAEGNLEPVGVEKGAGSCRIGIHRRKWVNGQIKMAPNDSGPLDSEVTVIRFQKNNGETKGVFFHYTCHPTTTGENFVSSEFTGVAMEKVEEELGGNAVASFLQGCCGDIRPILVRGESFYRGSAEDVCSFGETLSAEVIRILQQPMLPLTPCLLQGFQRIVSLPLQQLSDKDRLHAAKQDDNVVQEWNRVFDEDPSCIRTDLPLELTLLHIAHGLSFLAMDGEIVIDYGLFIKGRFSGKVLPLTYSNGMIGYIPTAMQLAEGGYESKDSLYYFALPSPFDPSLESIICKNIEELIEEGSLEMSSIMKPIKTDTVDCLRVRVYENRKAMGMEAGIEAAVKIRELLDHKERIRIVFAAAPSQNEFLETLSKEKGIDWSRITVFHMDEYIGLAKDAPQKFSKFLCDRMFDLLNPGEVHLIDSSNTIEAECKRYGDLLKAAPIDMVCLGIGENGHIAFNDPPVADFKDPEVIKAVELDDACRQQQVNDGCFPSLEAVPTHALTLTIPAMMSGTHLFCMVPGPTKQNAVYNTLNGPITTECPASILRQHSDCTLYVDSDSYGAVN